MYTRTAFSTARTSSNTADIADIGATENAGNTYPLMQNKAVPHLIVTLTLILT